MTTTTTVLIELGTAFWLLVTVIIRGMILWSKFGSEGMSRVFSSGVHDTFGR